MPKENRGENTNWTLYSITEMMKRTGKLPTF